MRIPTIKKLKRVTILKPVGKIDLEIAAITANATAITQKYIARSFQYTPSIFSIAFKPTSGLRIDQKLCEIAATNKASG